MGIDAASALVRACSFVALFQAAGAAVYLALFGAKLQRTTPSVQSLARLSAGAALGFTTLHYWLEGARMAGALAGLFDPMLQGLVWDSPLSSAWLMRSVGLLLLVTAIGRAGRAPTVANPAAVGMIIGSFLVVGHTARETSLWASLALALHVAVVAFWFGALLPLYMAARQEPGEVAERLVARFSRIATVLVPFILLAGALLMIMLLPSWSALCSTYGLMLLGKLAAFGVLMLLASLNRSRYGPRLAADAGVRSAFARTVLAEFWLICAVLAATAVLTSFFSPE